MAISIANTNMIKGPNNMHAIHTILLALSVLLLAGCTGNFITKPKPLLLETEISYGPPEYRQGYQDGCESALAAYGNSYQKSFYSLQKNAGYQNNRMYNQVWKDSWAYCYMWIFVANRQANDSNYGTLF